MQTFTITLPAERPSKHNAVFGGIQFSAGTATATLTPAQRKLFLQYGAAVEIAVDPNGSQLSKLTRVQLLEFAADAEPEIILKGRTKAAILQEIEAEVERRNTPEVGEPVEPVLDVVEPAAEGDEQTPDAE